MDVPAWSIAIKTNRLALLDGLRGIAAIGVMLFHAEVAFDSIGTFARGYLFVDFFFLLSGFVLTLSAERRMNEGWKTSSFLRARIVRLWPITAIGMCLGALAAALGGVQEDIPALLALGLMMMPAILGAGHLFPLNGPQWSIFFELLANLAHGLLLRRLTSRGLLCLILLAGAALAATIFQVGWNTLGSFSFQWWMALPRLFFSYSLGIWIGRKWVAGKHRPVVSWEVALVLPPVCLIALNAFPAATALGDIVMTLLLFPLLFWLAAVSAVPPAAEIWLRRAGALSFPLYAVHIPVLAVFTLLGKSSLIMWLAVCATIAAAWLVERGLHVTAMLRRRSLRPQPV
ncbi:MAG: acyltransferase [Novosphingobium sp.]